MSVKVIYNTGKYMYDIAIRLNGKISRELNIIYTCAHIKLLSMTQCLPEKS